MESLNLVKHQLSGLDAEAAIPFHPQSTHFQHPIVAEDQEHPTDGFPPELSGARSQLVVSNDRKEYPKLERYLAAATSDETSATTVVVSISENLSMESLNLVKHQPSGRDAEAAIPSDPQSTHFQHPIVAEDQEHPTDGFPPELSGARCQLVVSDDRKEYLKFEPYTAAATSDETSVKTVVVSVSENQPQLPTVHKLPYIVDIMGLSIFSFLCCFYCVGAFAVCGSFQAISRWEDGDYKRAHAWAKKAKFISIVAVICGIIFWVRLVSRGTINVEFPSIRTNRPS